MDKLLVAHALTGCDMVSAFAGIDKATVLKKLQQFNEIIDLGHPSTSMDDVTVSAAKFVATLYGYTLKDTFSNLRPTSF
jgi:hypothetical protein